MLIVTVIRLLLVLHQRELNFKLNVKKNKNINKLNKSKVNELP